MTRWKRQGFFSRKKALQYQKNSLLLSSRRKAEQIAEEHGFSSSSERAVERTEHEQIIPVNLQQLLSGRSPAFKLSRAGDFARRLNIEKRQNSSTIKQFYLLIELI